MASTFFRTIRKRLAPRWLTEGDGELVGYSLDLMKDTFVERLRLGLLARFPFNDPNGTTAPSDALAAMGRDRGVVRGLSESDASYATRLKAWLDDRKTQGGAHALLQKVAEYIGSSVGASFRTVDNAGNWYERTVAGIRSVLLDQGDWNWDGNAAAWGRFWVVFYPGTLLSPEAAWAPLTGTYNDGGTWGTNATPDEVATVQRLVKDWRPAGVKCVNVIVALDETSFDPSAPEPDGNWGRWSKVVGGVRVSSRLSTARYWDGA